MYLQSLTPEWSEKAIAWEDGSKLVGKVVSGCLNNKSSMGLASNTNLKG